MFFILDNQLLLLFLSFALGVAAVAPFLMGYGPRSAWLYADVVWVALGGVGALAALLAGTHVEDSSRLERQIDVAYATTTAFDRDAARFRLTHCEPSTLPPQVRALCDKVEYLSASTAENSALPLFLGITREVAPMKGLSFFSSRSTMKERRRKAEEADQFDPEMLLVFAPRDPATDAALDALTTLKPVIAAEFRVIAQSYDTLTGQVTRLYEEWAALQTNTGVLTLQVIALCLVAFAAPFRLGRSLVALL